ncbi:TetR family transcriptional regulator [Leclercia adecarboxylata]|uniref:TetR family transcriptional regulator n=1 Tax=Leclercia adecarboxylata TaxID=83655 RepID=A0A4U9HVE5_9ENTR|nr:TetR family transcriptional regulator [Leclercia adecarboxylata]
MTYLSKDERREAILQAAMRVALNDGFTGMTVRNIAAEAKVATGQVHHHFASAGELKAQAFISLIRALLDADVVAENASWRERLFAMLGSDDRSFEPYIRLWREAQLLAARDPEIKGAYLLNHGDVASGNGGHYTCGGTGESLYAERHAPKTSPGG